MSQKKNKTSAAVFTRLLVLQLLIPALVFAVLLFIISGILTLSSLEREQSHLTNSVGKILDEFLKDSKLNLKIAADAVDYSDHNSLQRLLGSSQSSASYLAELSSLDSQGNLFAVSPENPAELNRNHANDPYFMLGLASKDDVWISQPYLEKATGAQIIYTTKVTNSGGLVVGKIYLHDLLSMINAYVDPQDGRIIFVNDQFKNILTQSDPSSIEPQNSTDRPLYKFDDGSVLFLRQNQIIIQSNLKIQQTNWDVVFQLDPAYALRNYLLTTALIGLSCLILWWVILLNIRRDFSRLIANPLTDLRKYIQDLTDSNFSNKTRPVRMIAPMTEISDLASSFDEMSRSVYLRQYELRESEKKYRALIDQSVDAIFLEIDSKLVMVNPKFSEIFALYPDQLAKTPKNITDFAAAPSRAELAQNIRKLEVEESTELRLEFLAIDALGHEIAVEVSASSFPYQGSTAVQGILRDITQRKRIEREEHEQRLLAEALRDTAAVLNSTLNLDEVMQRILDNIKMVLPHDSSSIMLVENPPGYASIVAVKGYAERGMDTWAKNARFPIQKTPTLSYMYEQGCPVVVPDVNTDPTWVSIGDVDWIQSYLGAPIKSKNQTIGS